MLSFVSFVSFVSKLLEFQPTACPIFYTKPDTVSSIPAHTATPTKASRKTKVESRKCFPFVSSVSFVSRL